MHIRSLTTIAFLFGAPIAFGGRGVYTVHSEYTQHATYARQLMMRLFDGNPCGSDKSISPIRTDPTQIADQILSGELQPGAELPSIRKLASDLVISVITIKRAYQELESKGLIVTRPGIGSRVVEFTAADLHAMKLKKLRQQLRDVVRHAGSSCKWTATRFKSCYVTLSTKARTAAMSEVMAFQVNGLKNGSASSSSASMSWPCRAAMYWVCWAPTAQANRRSSSRC